MTVTFTKRKDDGKELALTLGPLTQKSITETNGMSELALLVASWPPEKVSGLQKELSKLKSFVDNIHGAVSDIPT